MRIFGTVKDAKEEKPIKGAKVSLSIAEKELAVLYTDTKGEFETSIAGSYIDEVLICKVEKDGYKSQRITYDIEENEVELEIELLSIELELNFCVKDEKGSPLQGVKVTLKLKEEQIGVGLTNKSGCFKFSLNRGLKGKKVNYNAELEDYEFAEGSLKLKDETSYEIIMKKASSRKFIWLPAVLGTIGGALGGFIFVLLADSLLRNSRVSVTVLSMGILYGGLIGLGLGIGLWQDMKKMISRLVVSGIIGFLVGALVLGPILFRPRIGPVVVSITIALWIGIVGLSFSLGLKNKKLTLRLIIAGLIAGLISTVLGQNAIIFAIFPISGLSFGIALGLPRINLWKKWGKWILIGVGIIIAIIIMIMVFKPEESRRVPVKEFPGKILEKERFEKLQPVQPEGTD